jgi:hypothetical protein
VFAGTALCSLMGCVYHGPAPGWFRPPSVEPESVQPGGGRQDQLARLQVE